MNANGLVILVAPAIIVLAAASNGTWRASVLLARAFGGSARPNAALDVTGVVVVFATTIVGLIELFGRELSLWLMLPLSTAVTVGLALAVWKALRA